MTVDKGGLQYPIEVKDQFSRPLADFANRVRAARKEVAGLRRDLASTTGGTGAAAASREAARAARDQARAAAEAQRLRSRARQDEIRDQREADRLADRSARAAKTRSASTTQASKAAAKAARDDAKEQARQQRILDRATELATRNQIRQQAAAQKLQSQATEQAIRNQLRIQSSRKAEIAAEKAAAQAQRQTQRQQAAAQQAAARALQQQSRAAAAAAQQARTRIAGLGQAATAASGGVSKLAGRLASLVALFAGFTAVVGAIRLFQALVRSTIEFSARLEQATLGIAALFTAVGDVRDPFGQAVDATQALVIAQQEARRQVQLLRRDALSTTASFEDLVETFQTAIAPGLQAGLGIDQIREFSVRISQSAAAIGLPQNQLAEEIRSILSATIQRRTTRIAVALGITNEDIRNAQELGKLAEFLNQKFSAFGIAGKEVEKTFAGLVSKLQTATQLLFQEGGGRFFEDSKAALQELFDLIATRSQSGLLEPSPRALELIRIFAGALSDILADAIGTAKQLSFDQIRNSVLTFVQGLRTGFAAARAAVVGLGKGANDVLKAVRVIAGSLSKAFGDGTLEQGVELFARLLVILLAVQAVVAITTAAVAVMSVAWAAIVGSVTLLLALLTPFGAIVAAAAVAIGVVVAGVVVLGIEFKKLLNDVAGVRLGIVGTAKAVSVLLGGAFKTLAINVRTSFATIIGNIRILLTVATAFIVDSALSVLETVLQGAALVSGFAGQKLAELRTFRKELNASLLEQADGERKRLNALQAAAKIQKALILFNGASSIVGAGRSEEADTAAIVERIKSAISSILPDFQGIEVASAGTAKSTEQVDGFVASMRQNLAEVDALFRELDESSRNSADSLKAGLATLGLQGPLLQQRQLAFQAEFDLRRKTEGLQRELLSEERQLAGFRAQADATGDLAARTIMLGQQVVAQQHILDIKRDIALVETEINRSLSLQQQLAASEGAFELRLDAAKRMAELSAQRNDFEARFALHQERARVSAEGILGILQGEVSAARELRDIELGASEAVLASQEAELARLSALKESVTNQDDLLLISEAIANQEAAIVASKAQQAALSERNVVLAQQEAQAILEAAVAVERLRLAADRPLAFGFIEGIRAAADEIPSIFEFQLNLTKNIILDFAEEAGAAFAGIFDPNNDITIQERLGRFLLQIGQQIVSFLIALATTTLLLNAIPGFASVLGLVSASGLAGGFNEGGEVKGYASGGRIGAPHRKARGFAGGGRPAGTASRRSRPSGLHPSDTVPIWTAVGEWVIRESSASKYGPEVMGAINDGLVNPTAMRGLVEASAGSSRPSHSAGGPGYASGGIINPEPQTTTGRTSAVPPTVLPLMVANEAQADKLLRGGPEALKRAVAKALDELGVRHS